MSICNTPLKNGEIIIEGSEQYEVVTNFGECGMVKKLGKEDHEAFLFYWDGDNEETVNMKINPLMLAHNGQKHHISTAGIINEY